MLNFFNIGCFDIVCGQLQVISTVNNQPFLNPASITVGLSSDLVVQVRCINISPGGGTIQWSYAVNGSEVNTGLTAFGTSQENGVLRVYPANVLTGEGAMFQCRDTNTSLILSVTFNVSKSATILCLLNRCIHDTDHMNL